MSKIIILLLSFFIASAASFNFTEIRYSDALDRSMELKGEISFLENGLTIKYKENKKSLQLLDGKILYSEDGVNITLDQSKKQKIIQYFETIFLLHSGNEKLLQEMFEVQTNANFTLLTPKGTMRHFVTKIELVKNEDRLKEIKLFLKNSDKITIIIDDEIR